jgi:hypothetical protein
MISAAVAGLIVGAAQAGTSIWKSYNASKEQEKLLEEQQRAAQAEARRLDERAAETKAAYQKELLTPTMEREENKAAMSETLEAAKEQNSQADSRAAIMGGSSEAVIAQRANNLKAIASTARGIAASAGQYKSNLTSRYNAAMSQNDALRAQNLATAQGARNMAYSALSGQQANASQSASNGLNIAGSAITEYFKSSSSS